MSFFLPLDFQTKNTNNTLPDLELLVQHFKFMKALSQVEPMNSIIAHEEDPKMNCTTDEEIRGSSILHPIARYYERSSSDTSHHAEYIKNTSGTSW